MRRLAAVLTCLLATTIAAPAYAGSLDLRGGGFFPRADTGAQNDLFRDDSTLYTVDKSDWNSFYGGIEWNMKVAPLLQLGFSVDGYSRKVDTSYRDYVRPNGREIQQTLELDMVPMGITLRLGPTDRGVFAPYIGGGVSFIAWEYEEYGEFIDFDSVDLPVVEDWFVSEGVNVGFHVVGGLRIPIGDDFSLVAEGRYQWAQADMGDDFRGNKLDLTGASATLGVNIRF
ncbi:MAG: outer membrane beta-barrel protein [Vicinamibacteria bacterium]